MLMLLIKWAINAVVLVVTAHLVPGLRLTSFAAAMTAALVLGLINTFVKPFFLLITLPVNIITLGLFTFVINALMLWFTASLVQGFEINRFASAILAAIVISVISVFLSIVG